MNKNYRNIWNGVSDTGVMVSELTKMHTGNDYSVKKSVAYGSFILSTMMSAVLMMSGQTVAAPIGTTTSNGTSIANTAGKYNSCYFDQITSAVVCGGTATSASSGNGGVVVGNSAQVSGLDPVSIGNNAGVGSAGTRNIAIGGVAGNNVKGSENIAMGFQSLQNAQSSENIGIGLWALQNAQETAASTAMMGSVWGTGHNTAIGTAALRMATGASNTAIGSNAGRYITGSGNFFGGLLAGAASGNMDRTVVIGNQAALVSGSYITSVIIGNYANGGLKGT